MMNKKIKKLLAIVLSLNILLIGVYIFLFFHIKSKIESSALIAEELRGNLVKERNIEFLKNTFKETEKERLKINSYFVNNEGIVDFIEEIEFMSSISGIDLDLKTASVEGEEEKVLKINFQTSGTFRNIYYFLTLVENAPHRIEFVTATFSKISDDDTWEGRFDMNLLSFIENK